MDYNRSSFLGNFLSIRQFIKANDFSSITNTLHSSLTNQQLDYEIDQYDILLKNIDANDENDDVAYKHTLIKGIILIDNRFYPCSKSIHFINRIINKYYICVKTKQRDDTFLPNSIIPIYQGILNNQDIETILHLFPLDVLIGYGW
jgi:hypothetical protein